MYYWTVIGVLIFHPDISFCVLRRPVQAPGLVSFWLSTFRVQIDAKSGAVDIHPEDGACPWCRMWYHDLIKSLSTEEPTRKRRKRNTGDEEHELGIDHDLNAAITGWEDGQRAAGLCPTVNL